MSIFQTPGADKTAIFAGHADGTTAVVIDQGNDLFVDQSTKYHLHHIHGAGIGDAYTVDKLAIDIETFEHVTDLRATTVNHHRGYAHGF